MRKMSRSQMFLIGGSIAGMLALVVTVVTVAVIRPSATGTDANSASNPPMHAGAGTGNPSGKRLLGYYLETATGGNCPGIPPMTPDRIPAQYYTHLIYGFSPLINTNTWELNRPSDDEVKRYQQFNGLKKTYPSLHTLLSLGGDLPDISPMSRMSSNPAWRQHFVQTTIQFVRQYDFDGIDLDWEFPNDQSRGGSVNDTQGFIDLVKEFRAQIDKESRPADKPKLLLSTIVPGGPYWGQYYSVDKVASSLDFINVIAYNVLGTWRGQTDCSAPLNNPHDKADDSGANALSYFLNLGKMAGASPDKFNFGISFWAIAFKLRQALNATATTSPPAGTLAYTSAEQPAQAGFCTRQPGYLAYFEVIRLLNKTGSTQTSDDPVSACKYFTYDRDQWVGYDDASTLSTKIDYAFSLGLNGVSVWGMDADNPDTFELTKSLADKLYK